VSPDDETQVLRDLQDNTSLGSAPPTTKPFKPKIRDSIIETKFFRWVLDSELEVPASRQHTQNAWLTIDHKVHLQFADANKPYGRVRVMNQVGHVKDADGWEFRVRNWDAPSMEAFQRGFLAGEKVWNHRFTLVTPRTYDGLDFTSLSGGLRVRPNVLGLFRLSLVPDPKVANFVITVVRLDPTFWEKVRSIFHSFRTNSMLYQSMDVVAQSKPNTLGHELGHSIGQEHILAMMGDPECKASPNRSRCYGTPGSGAENIMGGGDRFELINTEPWVRLIEKHTGVAKENWKPTLSFPPPRTVAFDTWRAAQRMSF